MDLLTFRHPTAAACVGLVLAALPAAAFAGAFGVNMGDPISKYKIEKPLGEGRYQLSEAPIPRSDLDYLIVTATPEHGICKVLAVGKDINNDAYGVYIQQKYNELKASLDQKYGKSLSYDFLMHSSIWNEPEDYAMSLAKEDRTLSSYWSLKDGSTVPDDIGIISLRAHGLNSSTTYWRIAYEFKNFDACDAQLKAKQDDAL